MMRSSAQRTVASVVMVCPACSLNISGKRRKYDVIVSSQVIIASGFALDNRGVVG